VQEGKTRGGREAPGKDVYCGVQGAVTALTACAGTVRARLGALRLASIVPVSIQGGYRRRPCVLVELCDMV
jgi:hypothetical protein